MAHLLADEYMGSAKDMAPIFIIGAQHSGTTILNKMLAMHPDLVWFSQFSQRDGKIPGRFRLPFYKFFNRFFRSCFIHDWRKISATNIRERLREYLAPSPRERSQIWDYILISEDMVFSNEFVLRMREIFSKECREWGNNRTLIVKYLILSSYINILRSIFPEARFIHIIRDGRAVALSIREKFLRNGDSQMNALKMAAKHWLDIVETVQSPKKNNNLYELKYEDFCLSPRRHISRILRFARLRSEKFPFYQCPERLRMTNTKWIENVQEEEMEMLNGMLKKWLLLYGYEISQF